MLFEDKGTPSFQVAFQIREMATAYKMPVIQKLERQLPELVINMEQASGFFDASSQRSQNSSSAGCILYFSKTHTIKMEA
jgi:hypothetical protein